MDPDTGESMREKSSARRVVLAAAGVVMALTSSALAQQRLLGIDVSDWQQEDSAGNPLTPIDWTLVHTPVTAGGGGKDFAFIRSTRGGTTGTYDKHDGT